MRVGGQKRLKTCFTAYTTPNNVVGFLFCQKKHTFLSQWPKNNPKDNKLSQKNTTSTHHDPPPLPPRDTHMPIFFPKTCLTKVSERFGKPGESLRGFIYFLFYFWLPRAGPDRTLKKRRCSAALYYYYNYYNYYNYYYRKRISIFSKGKMYVPLRRASKEPAYCACKSVVVL